MPKSSVNATARGPFLFSLAMLISGSIGLFVRLIDLSPINIVFFRCAFGAIALGIYVLVFGILLAFLGAALVSGITVEDILALNILGASYAFCAAVLYAALILLSKCVKHTDSAVTALVQTTIGTLILSFFADFDIAFVNLNWGFIVAIGAVHTALLYILFFRGIRDSPFLLVALLVFIDPLFAIFLDRFALGNEISAVQVIGIACIVLALTLKALSEQKTEPLTE